MPKAPKASPKAAATEPQPLKAKRTVCVTYAPTTVGDPPFVKWNGITFKANVPMELDEKNEAHFIEQDLSEIKEAPDGARQLRPIKRRVFMAELARGNPSFEVDGKRARAKKNTRVVPPPGAEWTDAHEGQISESDTIDESVAA